MPQIRILVADPSERLRAVVDRAVAVEPDLVVIEDGGSEVEALLRAEDADVSVVDMSGNHVPGLAERLLDEYPDIGVVAVDVERRQAVILQLRRQLTPIPELTPATLSAAIRQAAGHLVA